MIEFRNVSKVYPNGTKGLNNINLKIQKGEFVVMVGLSGAGKSTLLRSVNRLHEITEGEIMIEGESITAAKGKGLRRMRRDIGMIFQSFNLVKRSTVLKNVLAGRVGYHSTLRTTLGLFPKEDLELAFQSLKRVNILEKHMRVLMNYQEDNSNVYRLLERWRKKQKSYWQMNLLHR